MPSSRNKSAIFLNNFSLGFVSYLSLKMLNNWAFYLSFFVIKWSNRWLLRKEAESSTRCCSSTDPLFLQHLQTIFSHLSSISLEAAFVYFFNKIVRFSNLAKTLSASFSSSFLICCQFFTISPVFSTSCWICFESSLQHL